MAKQSKLVRGIAAKLSAVHRRQSVTKTPSPITKNSCVSVEKGKTMAYQFKVCYYCKLVVSKVVIQFFHDTVGECHQWPNLFNTVRTVYQ